MKTEPTFWPLKSHEWARVADCLMFKKDCPSKIMELPRVSVAVAPAKLGKALLSWGWSPGQFLIGSAGQNTWVKSPRKWSSSSIRKCPSKQGPTVGNRQGPLYWTSEERWRKKCFLSWMQTFQRAKCNHMGQPHAHPYYRSRPFISTYSKLWFLYINII